MSRSATTGVYTRVSNSFSQPVTGTTISPTDADTYFDDIDEAMNSFVGTSTTSLTIGTGTKTFTTQLTKSFLVGSFVQAFSQADHANYMYGTVTSYSTVTGALALDVVTTGGSGTLADWLLFTAGARGGTGATGTTGATSGIRQAYSATTTDTDPGAGTFQLNNATPASATAAYLDNLDSGGSTVSGIFDLWDDSTTTTKGFVRFEKSSDSTVWAQFAVTGSVVDGTGYRKLTLTSGAGSGAFTATDVFSISFFRSGDKGADGTVAGPGVSVDSEIALWSGTGGATLKRASTTGMLKGTSGVISAGTDGTDYLSSTTGAKQGKQTVFIPASSMISRTTNGPSIGLVELTTNKVMIRSLDFDTTTQEFAQFSVWFPKSWNLGTVTFQPSFSQLTTAAGGVVFGLAGLAVSTTDDMDAAFGTAQTSTTTAGTLNKEYQGPESAAITIAGTPAAGDRVIFQVNRTVADASDTLAQDARLHGIRLFFTTNAATDA